MRLVKDGKIILDGTLREYEKENLAFEKLEKIEDIEEELGIELLTLFKAFKSGIWYKDQGGVHYHKQPYDTLEENIAYFRRLFEKQYTENYGKTWALTKEELE